MFINILVSFLKSSLISGKRDDSSSSACGNGHGDVPSTFKLTFPFFDAGLGKSSQEPDGWSAGLHRQQQRLKSAPDIYQLQREVFTSGPPLSLDEWCRVHGVQFLENADERGQTGNMFVQFYAVISLTRREGSVLASLFHFPLKQMSDIRIKWGKWVHKSPPFPGNFTLKLRTLQILTNFPISEGGFPCQSYRDVILCTTHTHTHTPN